MFSKESPILILSNEPWGKIWFSKQHYANELARLGYRVIFLNPVPKWKFANLFSFHIQLHPSTENLMIGTYKNNFPVRIFPRLFTRINDFLNTIKLRRKVPASTYILWQFDPFRFVFLQKNLYKRIYHVADPYIHLSYDKAIAKRSDLIVCTSAKYLPFYADRNKEVIHIPHGISSEEFLVEKDKVEEIKVHFGPYVLLIGTLNNTVNFSLLQKIVEKGYTLVTIGKFTADIPENMEAWSQVKQSKNTHHLGPMHAKELKEYIQAAKLCITAYNFNMKKSVGQGSPLKILNYLAQAKPIVTTIDAEIPILLRKGIYQAHNLEEFYKLLDRGMSGKLPVEEALIFEYLKNHEYPALIQTILSRLCM